MQRNHAETGSVHIKHQNGEQSDLCDCVRGLVVGAVVCILEAADLLGL